MSRGDTGGAPSPRVAPLVLAVIFSVACLGALALVVLALTPTASTSSLTVASPSTDRVPSEGLARLRLVARTCAAGPGWREPGPPLERAIDDGLAARGYAPVGGWEPAGYGVVLGAPGADAARGAGVATHGLGPACGVLALATADGAASITSATRDAAVSLACANQYVLVPTCGVGAIGLTATGSLRARSFVLAGAQAPMTAALGVSPDELLAHAEAEVILEGLGWTAGDELVRATSLAPPRVPTAGCVSWVAHTHEVLSLTVSCAGDATSGPVAAARPPENALFRAYSPHAATGLAAPTAPNLEPLRAVPASAATLPATVPPLQ